MMAATGQIANCKKLRSPDGLPTWPNSVHFWKLVKGLAERVREETRLSAAFKLLNTLHPCARKSYRPRSQSPHGCLACRRFSPAISLRSRPGAVFAVCHRSSKRAPRQRLRGRRPSDIGRPRPRDQVHVPIPTGARLSAWAISRARQVDSLFQPFFGNRFIGRYALRGCWR
jgi:hypothetical protein